MRLSARRFHFSVVGLTLTLAGCGGEQQQPPEPIRPVLSRKVEPQTAQLFGPFTGVVEARYQTQLGFRTGGRIITRDATVGDIVKKGQRLASLDPRLSQLAMLSAHADLTNAEALVVNAKGNEQRKRALVQSASGGASQAQLDQAVATLQTAEAKLAQARASLQKAEEQASYTNLVADYDGVVSVWTAEIGQVVSSGQAVVTVARPDIREAVFDVPDNLMSNIAEGAEFTVGLLIDPSVTTTGKVREIAPQADASTLTRRIKLALDSPPAAFRLGTNVMVSLSEKTAPVVVLPASAILSENAKDSVWTVGKDGKVARRDVSVGKREPGSAVILSGVAQGDVVVLAGVHSLKEGQTVKLSGLEQ